MNKRKILIAITFVIMILTISACSPKGDKKEVDTGKKQTDLDTEDLGLEPKLPEFLLKNIEDVALSDIMREGAFIEELSTDTYNFDTNTFLDLLEYV